MKIKSLLSCALLFAAFFAVSTVQAEEQTKKELTFSMIKPTAVKEGHIGAIIEQVEKAKLRVSALKMTKLSKEEAERFYGEHKGKPFYEELVNMMSSGPIVAMVIEGDDSVNRLRELVGATDPKKAARGTIRAQFGKNVGENAIHASDSTTSATNEIPFFFTTQEVYP